MKKILVVDDSFFARAEIVQSSVGSDFKMFEAESATEAIDCLRANVDFSLAIIDYNMPDVNGIELTRALREISPQLPIIILSSHGTDQLKQDAKAAGASCWALKPISGPTLQQLITRMLGK